MPKVKVNDVEIYYEIRREGTPLVMISGYTRSSETWSPDLVEGLAKHHKLILFDNRGTGRSDKPDIEYSIKMMADDTAGLMDAINISKAHVSGFSMGGYIAQELALKYPDRVLSLILACTSCGGSKGFHGEEWGSVLKSFASGNPPEMSPALMGKIMSFALTPKYLAENRDTLIKSALSIKYPTPLFTRVRQAQAITKYDTYDRLSQIKAPTLVLHGKEDRMLPFENGKILAEGIPDAKLHVFENAGHMFWAGIERQVVRIMIQFMSENENV